MIQALSKELCGKDRRARERTGRECREAVMEDIREKKTVNWRKNVKNRKNEKTELQKLRR